MGFGGMAAVLVAMVGALTVLPALLAVLGHRVDSLRLRVVPARLRRTPSHGAPTRRRLTATVRWARLAHSVMRRPVVYVAVIVPMLLLAGSPFLRVEFGGVDHRALPAGTESRVVAETLISDFPGGSTSTVDPVVSFALRHRRRASRWPRYVERLRELPGVSAVDVTGAKDGTAVLSIHHRFEGISSEARDLVGQVRDVPAPSGAEVLVGGRAADLRDLLSSLSGTLPWMGLFVVGVTLLLLFLAFGSVVLPVKAVVMNVLSLSASFGALVWIFQDGHLSGLLGFDSTGAIEATQPILMLAMAFGLSMDYEVFLLSRIREQWDRTGDNSARRRERAAADRQDHHQRRTAARRGHRRVRHLGHRVHQDDRRRHDHRDHRRRRDRPDPSGAGHHALAGPLELVGTGAVGPVLGPARLPRVRRRAAADRPARSTRTAEQDAVI